MQVGVGPGRGQPQIHCLRVGRLGVPKRLRGNCYSYRMSGFAASRARTLSQSCSSKRIAAESVLQKESVQKSLEAADSGATVLACQHSSETSCGFRAIDAGVGDSD